MKSLVQKSLIRKTLACGMIVASFAFMGNTAMAADAPVKAPAKVAQVSHARVTHAPVARRVATSRRPAPTAQLNDGIAQFIQSMLGGPLPPQYTQIVQNALREAASHKYAGSEGSARDTGGYDPTFDSPTSSAVDVDNSQSQAAIDASDQAMQQEDQSLQDLDASIAEAEQQNNAANAAAVQTDINAGM